MSRMLPIAILTCAACSTNPTAQKAQHTATPAAVTSNTDNSTSGFQPEVLRISSACAWRTRKVFELTFYNAADSQVTVLDARTDCSCAVLVGSSTPPVLAPRSKLSVPLAVLTGERAGTYRRRVELV